MQEANTPEKWAIRISHILDEVLGKDRFPVEVAPIAADVSKQLYPDDPISLVKGGTLDRFEGALVRAPRGKKGWGILYNTNIGSAGRINFTLGHEFGHYLIHRVDYQEGFNCSSEDMVRWDSRYRQVENEANVFASYLLMPLDDFRRQISPSATPDLDALGNCADRYDVSLTAATLKWLSYTQRRAVLVVSRDGYILWSRSSKAAYRSGVFFKTANAPPRPIPTASIAAQGPNGGKSVVTAQFEQGVWFEREPCTEVALFSDRYDLTISLLQLGASPRWTETGDSPDGLEELRGLRWS